MKHFIPAWYSKSNDSWWEDRRIPFYTQRFDTEFDDMVSLMNIYKKNNVQFDFILLNYFPGLRTFLHRNNLFEARYWSLFDEIQGFNHKAPQAIDYRDLQWPEGTEFVFTPFLIKCITGSNSYTNIHFNQEGYLIWLEDFEKNKKIRRYIFDDRGWLSSIKVYDNQGLANEQYYLTIDGEFILTENLKSGDITISEKYQHRFKRVHYNEMSQLIEELFTEYCKLKFSTDDRTIVAADERHNGIITKNLIQDTFCFSVFSNRNDELTDNKLESIQQSNYWIVDTLDNEIKLNEYKVKQNLTTDIMRITPFDTQKVLNISSQLYETYIGIWIDGLSESKIQSMISILQSYIEINKSYRLVLLSKKDKSHLPNWLKDEIDNINNYYHNIEKSLDVIEIQKKEDDYEEFICIKHVPFETDLIEAISTLRIIIDINKEPDLFLQISSISSGLPQINMRVTEYVKDGINGKIIGDENDLIEALDYFLCNLKNWNTSYAYSLKLVEEYSSENILNQLNNLIEGEIYGKKEI
nr:accessory Sec system protein Asp1 [Mammaliicoccus sp. Marseille-Q6498]